MYHGVTQVGGQSAVTEPSNRPEVFVLNLRSLICAEKDKLIVADLSQIEVRTLAWLANDEDALLTIKNSDDIYRGLLFILQWEREHKAI